MLALLGSSATLGAQETKPAAAEGSLGAGAAGSPAAAPLARYFPKENLVFYSEFSGLNAHAEAWNKTAASKMLTETPLGEMLEQVGTQLMDKLLSYSQGRKLEGKDIIALLKHAAQHGYAMGLHMKSFKDKPERDSFTFTMVVRGAASKEARGLWSRAMGMFMAGGSPVLDKKEGRTVVVVTIAQPGGGQSKEGGRAWWAEKDDLVFSGLYPWGPDRVMAALDGKVPSAVDHPIVQELGAREGTFEPVGIAFLDIEHVPQASAAMNTFFANVREKGGIQRIAFRAGFDDDALMRELRIVAPRPRKPFLALFDQPGFDGKGLMPLPEGVGSFVELSIDPNALLDSIAQLGPEGVVKGKIDEFAEAIRSSGKIDFRKDFLGRIGPRMTLFVAPDKSATVTPGSFETNWLQGFNPRAGIPTAALSHLPKMTLLAEVSEPKTFARTLEGAINALNHELEARAKEMAEKKESENAQPGAGGPPGAGGLGGQRPGGGPGGQRGGTRRRGTSTPAPRFQAMLGSGSATASPTSAAYILQTPSDSPLKIGPPNFRPVIKFDGKYLVISVGTDSADAALKAAKQKGWKPSEDLQRASEHLPPKMVVLGVGDPREMMPAFLASLPGTLQTIINTAITVARNRAANAQQGGAGGPGPGGPGGRDMMASRMGGRMGPGGPGGFSGGGPPPGVSGRSGPPPGVSGGGGPPGGASGAGGPESGEGFNIPADAMVELKVDSDKLPKAEDLRSRYFLSTLAITVNDQDIRVVTRQAFLTPADIGTMGVFVGGLLPAIQAARAAAQKAQAANEQAAGGQAPAAGPGAGGPPRRPGAGGPPGRGGGAMPGRGGGRRGGRDE